MLNKRKIYLLFILLIFFISPIISQEKNDEENEPVDDRLVKESTYFRVVNVKSWDVLNMRSKASDRSEIVNKVYYRTSCLKNMGCVGGLSALEKMNLSELQIEKEGEKKIKWCLVDYKNTLGWVHADFITPNDKCK